MLDESYIEPPGCKSSIVSHPSDESRAVEVAVIQDHRFAFFFWLKWTLGLEPGAHAPSLVSLDWHEDLASPSQPEIEELDALPMDNLRDVALFCWEKLNPLNDDHILAAAYLNLVGDVYVLRKQKGHPLASFEDRSGRLHCVSCFSSAADLVKALQQVSKQRVFFDIDLDYFTESPDSCGGGSQVSLVEDQEIAELLHPQGDLMSCVFPGLCGMTIATEPDFCGGVINSGHLLRIVSDTWFHPQLLARTAAWRHLRSAE